MLLEKAVVSQTLEENGIGYVHVWNDKRQGFRRLKYFLSSPKDTSKKLELIRSLLLDKLGESFLSADLHTTRSVYSNYVSLVVKLAH